MTTGVPVATGSDRLRHLEGFRGLAALGVVVGHVAGAEQWVAGSRLFGLDGGAWAGRLGNFGVCLFFVLSGLLLYRPYAGAHLDAVPAMRWRTFLRRRALRILPAYWVALTAVLVLGYTVYPQHEWHSTVVQYALVQNYVGDGLFSGLFVAWTLSVELGFYLLLPLLAAGFRRLPGGAGPAAGDRLAAQVAGIAIVWGLGWAYRLLTLYGGLELPGSANTWLPNYFDWFAIGMSLGLARAWQERGGRLPAPLAWLRDHPGLSLLFAVQTYWIGVQLNIPTGFSSSAEPSQSIGRFLVNGAAAALLLAPSALGTRRTAMDVLDRTVLATLGRLSYGLYLWHTIVIRAIEDLGLELPFAGTLTVTVAVSLVLADLSFRLVEAPAMALRGRAPAARHAAPRLATS